MKKFYLIHLLFIGLTVNAFGQSPIDENSTPSSGITHQEGPGVNNTLNWTYPYGVKLSVWRTGHRNFELVNTGKTESATLAFRTYNGESTSWNAWKTILMRDGQKRLIFPVTSYFSPGVNQYDGDLLLQSNNSGLSGNYGASISFSKLSGGLTKRAAIASRQTSSDVDNMGLAFFTHGNIGSDDLQESMLITGSGNVGIGTSAPEERLHVEGTTSISGDIGTMDDAAYKLGEHTLELQNRDAGDVVLAFHRQGHSSSYIKHGSTGGLTLTGNGSNSQSHLFIDGTGQVAIGTTSPDAKLTVNGDIHTKEVKVDLSVPGPDYVFEPDYDLITLEETKAYIRQHKHLPEIPTAVDMETNGVEVGEMSMLLLKKIEEMTLHQIELMEEVKALKAKVADLEK